MGASSRLAGRPRLANRFTYVKKRSGQKAFVKLLGITLLLFAPIFGGCAPRLDGKYEARPSNFGSGCGLVDPDTERELRARIAKLNEGNLLTLDFHGSKVRFGPVGMVREYRYEIKGAQLDVISEAMGQKTIFPMVINSDESIRYLAFVFRKAK